MATERWRRIEEVFHAAAALSGEERAAFLQEACDGDPSLRQEVERVVSDTEPERPSAVVMRIPQFSAKLKKQLAGDLDNIVLNPSDSYARRDLSDCYERLGKFHATESAGPRLPTSKKVERWGLARRWYQKSFTIWNEWTKWGTSNIYVAKWRDHAARALAECDAALGYFGHH